MTNSSPLVKVESAERRRARRAISECKNMDIIKILAGELEIKPAQAEAAVKLIDEGNTIPFIARYRKEVTGSLNDEVLRRLYDG